MKLRDFGAAIIIWMVLIFVAGVATDKERKEREKCLTPQINQEESN